MYLSTEGNKEYIHKIFYMYRFPSRTSLISCASDISKSRKALRVEKFRFLQRHQSSKSGILLEAASLLRQVRLKLHIASRSDIIVKKQDLD